MAPDEPTSARQALLADAERLKQKRLAAEEAERQVGASGKERYELARQSITSAGVRKALSPIWIVALAICCAAIAGVALAMPTLESTGDSELPTQAGIRVVALIFGSMALLTLGHHLTAVLRADRWLARLPFKVEGFDHTLGGGMAVTKAEVQLSFADTAPGKDVVAELVKARLPEGASVRASDLGLSIVVEDLSTESSNFPVARWFRKVVMRVLLDVHRAYPIAHVKLRGLDKRDFYYGSGD